MNKSKLISANKTDYGYGYTVLDKIKAMLETDTDKFTIDKTVTGINGGMIELYFHYTLTNPNGDNTTIYHSMHKSNDRVWMLLNTDFDSSANWDNQPGGEHYTDSDGNVHAYPKEFQDNPRGRRYIPAGITLDSVPISYNRPIYIAYGDNHFILSIGSAIQGDTDYDSADFWDRFYRKTVHVYTTNPLGSAPKAIVFMGYNKQYGEKGLSIRYDNKWYQETDIGNPVYNNRTCAIKFNGKNSDYFTLKGANLYHLVSYKDDDGNRQWSAIGNHDYKFLQFSKGASSPFAELRQSDEDRFGIMLLEMDDTYVLAGGSIMNDHPVNCIMLLDGDITYV